MTGPEFAKAHDNDSTDWTAADFEAAEVFASIDVQPAWLLLHPKRNTQQPTTPTDGHDLVA